MRVLRSLRYGFTILGGASANEYTPLGHFTAELVGLNTVGLTRHGYTEEQISKIWSGNLLRVWSEVEKVAKQIPK